MIRPVRSAQTAVRPRRPRPAIWFATAAVLAVVDVSIAHLSNAGVLHWTPLGQRLASPVPLFWPLLACALGVQSMVPRRLRAGWAGAALGSAILLGAIACYAVALNDIPSR